MTGWTEERLILAPLRAQSAREAITRLGALLEEAGYVRETFVDAVLAREQVYATGLPTPEIHVAIPHTDVEHVIAPAIAVGVLDEPVEFGEMGNPDAVLPVRIIFLLALAEADTLVLLLQRLASAVQEPAFLRQLCAAGSAAEIAALVNQSFALYQEA